MSVEVLAPDFSVAKVLPCAPRDDGTGTRGAALLIDCELSGADVAVAGGAMHVGLRFRGKQQPHHKISRALVSTTFA